MEEKKHVPEPAGSQKEKKTNTPGIPEAACPPGAGASRKAPPQAGASRKAPPQAGTAVLASPGRRVAFYGIFTALALLLGYVEMLVQIPLPVPGAKLGLPNLVVLLALYLLGPKAAWGLSALRVALSALLFSGFAAFWFSLAGAMLSLLAMSACYRLPHLGIIGVSVVGGVCHNLGQLIIAGIIVQNLNMVYYLPLLLVFGVAAGTAMGLIAAATLPHLRKFLQG